MSRFSQTSIARAIYEKIFQPGAKMLGHGSVVAEMKGVLKVFKPEVSQ
jgi:hypothetical protein